MITLALLAAGAGFYISLKQAQQQAPTPDIEGLFWPSPKQIYAFNTIDQHGKTFGLEQIRGLWSLVFFGYTHCPDICPITMAVLADSYQQLVSAENPAENLGGNRAENNIQIIFVSVDPERDTTATLARYVSYFNKNFIGLGGTVDMIESLTKQIGIAYYIDKKKTADNYLVDHSASIFLLDPKARLVGKLSAPHATKNIIEQFTRIKKFVNAQD